MAQEIERKFLVTGDGWAREAVRSERLVDGLLATSKGRKVRVRLYEGRATLAIKAGKIGRSRSEFEYEIPRADAEQLLGSECGRTVLAKVRHYVPHANFMWEVDVYEPPLEGVIVAEVELAHVDQDPSRPALIGREVTDDPAFRKQHLFAERARKLVTKAPSDKAPRRRNTVAKSRAKATTRGGT